MTLKAPEAVIFDWDGTLVNTLPGLRLAHNHVRTSLGHPPWTEAEFMANLKYSSRELYPKIYGDKAQLAFETLYKFIEKTHIDHLDVLPGAEDLLIFLQEHRIPAGLASNKVHNYLVRETEHLGWDQYFYCILGSGKAARDKPAADPILLALQLAKIPLAPEKIWFVGDTVTDLLAARESGSIAVLITHGQDRRALIEEHKPALVVEDCAHLRQTLQDLFYGNSKNKAC
jgi:phosphoglycolate phosphatase